MQILSNPIYALNVRESPKFPRLIRNRGRGTRRWRQILDQKWKDASGHNYRNSSFIVELPMGQIPRSTERISSFDNTVTLVSFEISLKRYR